MRAVEPLSKNGKNSEKIISPIRQKFLTMLNFADSADFLRVVDSGTENALGHYNSIRFGHF